MSASDLNVQLLAALAEQIYHRSGNDAPITLRDLGVSAIPDLNVADLATSETPENGVTYYSSRGFVGEAVRQGDVVYVVFRGTDLSGSFRDGFKLAIDKSLDQTALPDAAGQIDVGDCANDILLGNGTAQVTQLDDALALTQAAKTYAASRGLKVVVVGQSLGGGLAGLVSAIANVRGYAIDPAPFAKQLQATAFKLALAAGKFERAITRNASTSSEYLEPPIEALKWAKGVRTPPTPSDRLL